MSNYGTGFAGFKSAIVEVTEALGGYHTHEAVAKLFSDYLTRSIQARRGDRYPSYSALIWTQATDIDFDDARDDALHYLCRLREPVDAYADWKGGRLEHRGDTIVLTGGGYSMIVAMVSSREEYDWRSNGNITKWHIHIVDDAKRLLDSYFNSSPSSTTAKTEGGGQKSLRKIVETFFKVKFKDEGTAE